MRIVLALLAVAVSAGPPDTRSMVGDRVMRLTRDSSWTLAASVPMVFRTFHPQGLVKIGDTFFLSSVEVIDRGAGTGVGHLFKIDGSGGLVDDLRLGDGSIYHPGGIDFDGTNIWVPVAEYRPDSRSIVYRVDPRAMKATEVFRVADHIGAIVHDTDDDTLHGVSWGSRRFYRWTMSGRARGRTLNPSHYVDYQDCKYAGRGRMLCTGIADLRQSPSTPPFPLGGIELIDLAGGRARHQVPLLLWTPGGSNMARNPVWIEAAGASGLRAYFVPDDETSTLYIYDVT